MAETTETVQVNIIARIKELLDPLKQAKDAVGETAGSMKGAFDGLGSAFGAFGKVFATVGAVVAGGAAFKEAVKATKDWNGEVIKLAGVLGITTQEASALNLALGDIYTDSQTYIAAQGQLAKQINAGGEAFKKLGVELRDSNGHLKPTTVIMAEVMGKLGQIEPGIQRTAAGMSIFGRQWGEAAKLVKLNSEVLEEARLKAEKLNLIVGGDAVEAQKKYKAAMNDMDDVMLGLKVSVGQEIMPVLADFGQWMADVAPPAIAATSWAIKAVVTGLYTLGFMARTIWASLKNTFSNAAEGFVGIGKAISAAVRGDFHGAADAVRQANATIESNTRAMVASVAADYDKLGEKLVGVWDKDPSKGGKVAKGGGATFDPGSKGNDEGQMRAFTAELKAKQDAEAEKFRVQGIFYEMSLAEEREFWAKKSAIQGLAVKDRQAIAIKIADIDRAARKEELQARLAALQEEADANQFNLQRKRELAIQEQGMYREGTAAYEAARRKVLGIDREIEQERRGLMLQQIKFQEEFDLAIADLNIQNLQAMADAEGTDRARTLQEIQTFELQKIQIKRDSLQRQLEDFKGTEEQRREIENRLNMLGLEERRLTLQQQAEMNKTMAEGMRELFNPVTEAWNSAMAGMLHGTMTLGQGWKSLLQGMGKMLDQAVMQMVNSWIAAETKKLAITAAAKIKELILHQSTAAATIATTTTTATAQVTAAGAVAGANAAASAAQTPMYGWAIAVPAGLAVLAAVMALKGRIGSAAGGWERVPHDQMAMIHKDEQVLPAKYAEGLRNLVENGGAGQQAPAFAPSFNITALDARGVERVLRDNNSAVGQAVRDYARNFGRS